ncbi:MAG: hypothetical protein QXM52_07335 [Candidatus Bathyarchaeia archaeon]
MNTPRINLNVAKAHVGKNVNLHLKDGSVIVNVQIIEAKHEKDNGGATIRCIAPKRKRAMKFLMKEIEWMETLNSHLLHS